jgi:hypothetical protein
MLILLLVLVGLLLLGIGRLLGWYRPKSYEAVPHKERIHYVPKNKELQVPLDQFPTRPPKEHEYITVHGELEVKK